MKVVARFSCNVYKRFSVDGEKTAKTITYRRERLDVFLSRKMHYFKKRKFTLGWTRQMWSIASFGKLMKALVLFLGSFTSVSNCDLLLKSAESQVSSVG